MTWGFLMIESSSIVGDYFPYDDLKNSFPNRICFIRIEKNPSPNDASVDHSKHSVCIVVGLCDNCISNKKLLKVFRE